MHCSESETHNYSFSLIVAEFTNMVTTHQEFGFNSGESTVSEQCTENQKALHLSLHWLLKGEVTYNARVRAKVSEIDFVVDFTCVMLFHHVHHVGKHL